MKLIIRSEHIRLLHAGPTLTVTSLRNFFHIISLRATARTIIRSCIACRHQSAKPQCQLVGQLPAERVTPGIVFQRVGVDYAGPISVKYGYIRKPTIVKSYVCVFVSLAVKAVHLELVSDLMSEAFIATLRRFIARRELPSTIWSDHGTNFVGANNQLCEFFEFLRQQSTQDSITDYCSAMSIEWKFIPEHAPHFGGLWEAAVKSLKNHLKRVMGDARLTFEELTTVLAQIESCMNS